MVQQYKKNILGILPIGIPSSEIKDVLQNLTSAFQLLPSNEYYNFYDGASHDKLLPFKDDRDIDDNQITGSLTNSDFKQLLTNLNFNMGIFSLAEIFHNSLDTNLNNNHGVKLFSIVGTNNPTLGQIHETWWVTWPINLINKRDEIFINGDGTVPLYSASLKSDSKDLSNGAQIYFTEQTHSELVNKNGAAMQTVKSILGEGDSLPVEVRSEKYNLEGQQLSVDDAELDLFDEAGNHTGLNSLGEIEIKIPDTYFDDLDNRKHVFIKKKAPKVTAKVTKKTSTLSNNTSSKTTIKLRSYAKDKIEKTTLYKDISLPSNNTPIQITINPATQTTPVITAETQQYTPSSETTGDLNYDLTPPITTVTLSGSQSTTTDTYTGSVTISLGTTDASGSGVLKTEYTLDDGITTQTYIEPITITTSGTYIIYIKSTDKNGNEEIPQKKIFTILTSSSTTSVSGGTSSSNAASSTNNATAVLIPNITDTVSKVLTNSSREQNLIIGNKIGEILGSESQAISKAFQDEPISVVSFGMTLASILGSYPMLTQMLFQSNFVSSLLSAFKPTPK